MNTNPRQLQLLEEVRARKSATVEQLAETLGVTLQTVRRDVQRLAESGLLTRFHGGVRVPSSTVENLAHTQRETLHADGKARIARAVAEQVPNDCSLILNIGTTTEAIAKALLHHRGLRVITNNLNVAAILSSNPECEVIVAGGVVRARDRGSVIPFFLSLAGKGALPITDERMTRFMITLEQGVDMVWHAFGDMIGGEIYVRKIPSMKVTDIARAVAPGARHDIVGIRPGEKLHEQMIGPEDVAHTYEYDDHFKILPAIHHWSDDPERIKRGRKVASDFIYSSDNNTEWMSPEVLGRWIAQNEVRLREGICR